MHNIIKEQVTKLVKKHNTRNPFIIAAGENIIVKKEPLGTIYGYYNKYVRQQFIHINSNHDEHNQTFTCCHEMGHAINHPDSNTPFLRHETFFSVDKLEVQANTFAAELLISDEDIKQFFGTGLCIHQIAAELHVRHSFVELKIKNLGVSNFF